ncbi:MAG: hypothetical protein N5P05_001798 [Chroococcopsis gigantea SAG 12.99]|jgi:hypothetical protein|nr:hypothetical protein [Chroococcopsis gigantea SAG 12.99]
MIDHALGERLVNFTGDSEAINLLSILVCYIHYHFPELTMSLFISFGEGTLKMGNAFFLVTEMPFAVIFKKT